MHCRIIIYIFLNIYFNCVSGTEIDDVMHRSRRQLLFPNSTLLQFNAGVGTPSPAKNVNVNWAFQANFQLPWNRTQIPTDILNVYAEYDGTSRKKRESGNYENDAKLYHFYKYVEDVLNRSQTFVSWRESDPPSVSSGPSPTAPQRLSEVVIPPKVTHPYVYRAYHECSSFGHDGHSCMKQALCQIGAQPLHSEDEEDLLHELVSFVLNPNNDVDDGHVTEQHESFPYIQAHRRGQASANCVQLYANCKFSLVDTFSQLH